MTMKKLSLWFALTLLGSHKASPPIHEIKVMKRAMYIVRDDLHVLKCGDYSINGNKTRKFQKLWSIDALPRNARSIMSYGGTQSNSMLALAKISHAKSVPFIYCTKGIPAFLRKSPTGNYKEALELGMQVIVLDKNEYSVLAENGNKNFNVLDAHLERLNFSFKDVYWVPQGGAHSEAEEGVNELTANILSFIRTSQSTKPWKIIFCSGTGTTAFFAARYLALHSTDRDVNVEAIAIPVAGSKSYLMEQMTQLDEEGDCIFPRVLSTCNTPLNRQFAEPYIEHLQLWHRLKEDTNIDFDLIYAPRAFELMLEDSKDSGNVNTQTSSGYMDLSTWMSHANIIYYHCGGLEGNPTQLSRYRYKKLIE